MAFSLMSYTQNMEHFVVLEQSVESSTYRGPVNYVTSGSDQKAPEQIAQAISNFQLEELHIYVNTKPGAMVFGSVAITMESVDVFAKDFSAWKQNVRQRVIIHSDVVFEGQQGEQLKQRLEAITGLEFIAQN